jgi:hypothetical protein
MPWFLEQLINSEKIDPWINLGLLVVGTFYTVFALCQWLAILKQAKIASRAAEAASDANRIATETLLMRRARLSMERVSMFLGGDNRVYANYKLVNTGDIPATGIVSYSRRRVAEVGDCEIKRDTGFIRDPNPEGTAEILNPHAEKEDFRLDLGVRNKDGPTLTQEELGKIDRGEMNIQVGVGVVYWDGFRNKRTAESWLGYDRQLRSWVQIARYQD